MLSFNLEELAHSFVQSKLFWPHEAVIVVTENYQNQDQLIVVEGNRRIATLKWLRKTLQGNPPKRSWETLFPVDDIDDTIFNVPYFTADERHEVDDYIGFRHVTGVKPWSAVDKASFMAQLLERGHDYDSVRRIVGSQTATVKSNYVAYKTLVQMEESLDLEQFDPKFARNRFALLYMTLKTSGATEYLNLDVDITPSADASPVPTANTEKLERFAKWLFGNEVIAPLVNDTRKVSDFGKVLANANSLSYLENFPEPTLERALSIAGHEIDNIINNLTNAIEYSSLALTKAHNHRDNEELIGLIRELDVTVTQLKSAIQQT